MRLAHCLLFAPLLLGASPAFADQLSCDGPFAADSTEQSLVDAFGRDNVLTGEVDGPEGTTMLATTVFPNDPDKKFEVGWWDEDARARIAYVTVPARDTAPGGVRIGMGVADVEALNGEPFTVYGFWWDYGGSAGFQTGKLSTIEGGCYLNLTFDPTVALPADVDPAPISGDQEVPSDLPLLRQVEPKVIEMSFGYPDYSATED